MALSSEIPYTELTRRTLASAVVGAAAVAAAGGSEKDIIQGFLTGTALTLASAYYNGQVGRDMDGRLATGAPIDKFDPKQQEYYGVFCDEEGRPVLTFNERTQSFEPRIDTNNIPARISQVGIASREALGGIADMVSSESAIPMRLLADGIPMMNAMAALHDHLCDLYALQNSAVVMLTIIPASILTVAASETPLDALLLATLNSADAQNKLHRDDSGYLVLPGKVADPEPHAAGG